MDGERSKAIKLEERFWSIAQQTAEFHFYELTPQRASFLRQVIREGIGKIITENRMSDRQSIDLAEDNLVKFVTKLAEMPDKGSVENALDISQFRSALPQWLCPCWPFC